MMSVYVWRDGGFVNKASGTPMHLDREGVFAPAVMRDVPEYRSPIDGKPISSRSHQREDLKRNDCVLAEPKKPRGFTNRRFAKKHGLALSQE